MKSVTFRRKHTTLILSEGQGGVLVTATIGEGADARMLSMFNLDVHDCKQAIRLLTHYVNTVEVFDGEL